MIPHLRLNHRGYEMVEGLTLPQAGQMIGRTPIQVTRLITLGVLVAHQDARGWWRVDEKSLRRFAEEQSVNGTQNKRAKSASR